MSLCIEPSGTGYHWCMSVAHKDVLIVEMGETKTKIGARYAAWRARREAKRVLATWERKWAW